MRIQRFLTTTAGATLLSLVAAPLLAAAEPPPTAPATAATRTVLLDEALREGERASARVFGHNDEDAVENAQSEADAAGSKGVSKSTFLIGAGIVASAIVAAAWLMRPKEPCREPLAVRFDTGWWNHVRQLTDRRPGDPPIPAPPPIPIASASAGCFYG